MVRYPTAAKKSFRKGVNGEPVPKGWVKKRKADNARKPPPRTRKRKRHARPRARTNLLTTQRLKKNKDNWESSLEAECKLATSAVFHAQEKLALGTLRPPGYRMLMSALPKSWRMVERVGSDALCDEVDGEKEWSIGGRQEGRAFSARMGGVERDPTECS